MALLMRLLVAGAVLIIVGVLATMLFGPWLVATGLPFVVILGDFFIRAGWVLAFAIAILVFARGSISIHW